jgi:hypothetical protein
MTAILGTATPLVKKPVLHSHGYLQILILSVLWELSLGGPFPSDRRTKMRHTVCAYIAVCFQMIIMMTIIIINWHLLKPHQIAADRKAK